jgi:hypothetical protein
MFVGDLTISALQLSPCPQVAAVVTDTAANMVAAGRELTNQGIAWHGCLAHLLELVHGVLYKVAPVKPVLAAARKTVGKHTMSSQQEAKLLRFGAALGKRVKLIQDVPTRWSSTADMCARLVAMRPVFQAMTTALGEPNPLTTYEWTVLELISMLLHPLREAQELLEGQKYVTISLVPTIVHQLRTRLRQKAEAVSAVAANAVPAAYTAADAAADDGVETAEEAAEPEPLSGASAVEAVRAVQVAAEEMLATFNGYFGPGIPVSFM